MPDQPSPSRARSFRVHVGARSLDVTLSEDAVLIDGRPVDVTLDPLSTATFALRIDGRNVTATIEPGANGNTRVTVGGSRIEVRVQDETDLLRERFGIATGPTAGGREVRAPMPGLVRAVSVAPGDHVAPGAPLLVLEAMKMENEIRSDTAGVVRAVHVSAGDAVRKNTLLVEFDS